MTVSKPCRFLVGRNIWQNLVLEVEYLTECQSVGPRQETVWSKGHPTDRHLDIMHMCSDRSEERLRRLVLPGMSLSVLGRVSRERCRHREFLLDISRVPAIDPNILCGLNVLVSPKLIKPSNGPNFCS